MHGMDMLHALLLYSVITLPLSIILLMDSYIFSYLDTKFKVLIYTM